MKVRVLLCAAVLGLVAPACGLRTSDSERLDRVTVDGQECMVVRNGIGRVEAVDCDWSHR